MKRLFRNGQRNNKQDSDGPNNNTNTSNDNTNTNTNTSNDNNNNTAKPANSQTSQQDPPPTPEQTIMIKKVDILVLDHAQDTVTNAAALVESKNTDNKTHKHEPDMMSRRKLRVKSSSRCSVKGCFWRSVSTVVYEDKMIGSDANVVELSELASPRALEKMEARRYLPSYPNHDPAYDDKYNLDLALRLCEMCDFVYFGALWWESTAVPKHIPDSSLLPMKAKVYLGYAQLDDFWKNAKVNSPWNITPATTARDYSRSGCFHKREIFIKEGVVFDSHTGTEALILKSESRKEIYVIFRGTADTKDILAVDAKVLPVRNPYGAGHVHQGFLRAYTAVAPMVEQAINELLQTNNYRFIRISGHSLGGALATIAAQAIWFRFCDPKHKELNCQHQQQQQQQSQQPQSEHQQRQSKRQSHRFPFLFVPNLHISVYTFGSPMVGTQNFATDFDSKISDSYRHALNTDLAPLVPFASWGFRHVKRLVLISELGLWIASKPMLVTVNHGARNAFMPHLNHSIWNYTRLLKRHRAMLEMVYAERHVVSSVADFTVCKLIKAWVTLMQSIVTEQEHKQCQQQYQQQLNQLHLLHAHHFQPQHQQQQQHHHHHQHHHQQQQQEQQQHHQQQQEQHQQFGNFADRTSTVLETGSVAGGERFSLLGGEGNASILNGPRASIDMPIMKVNNQLVSLLIVRESLGEILDKPLDVIKLVETQMRYLARNREIGFSHMLAACYDLFYDPHCKLHRVEAYFRRKIDRFDTDNSHTIAPHDIPHALMDMNIHLSKPELMAAFAVAGLDANKRTSFTEMFMWLLLCLRHKIDVDVVAIQHQQQQQQQQQQPPTPATTEILTTPTPTPTTIPTPTPTPTIKSFKSRFRWLHHEIRFILDDTATRTSVGPDAPPIYTFNNYCPENNPDPSSNSYHDDSNNDDSDETHHIPDFDWDTTNTHNYEATYTSQDPQSPEHDMRRLHSDVNAAKIITQIEGMMASDLRLLEPVLAVVP